MLDRTQIKDQFKSDAFKKSAEAYRNDQGIETSNPTLWDMLFANTEEIGTIKHKYESNRQSKVELAKVQSKLAKELNVDLVSDGVSARREQLDTKLSNLC